MMADFLVPGNYSFVGTIFDESFANSMDMSLVIEPSPLVAKMDRSSGSYSISQDLVLDAGQSYDPDNLNNPLRYKWACIHP